MPFSGVRFPPLQRRRKPLSAFFGLSETCHDWGAYWTVTAHDLPLLIAVPVQASEVIENAVEPESETVSIPVAEPPSS